MMTKRVELYFKSEDAVESAHASLRTLKVNNVNIEEIPDDVDPNFLVSFFPNNVGSPGFPTGTFSGSFPPMIMNNSNDNDTLTDDRFTHLLRVDVKEEDYHKFQEIMNNYDCYIAHKK